MKASAWSMGFERDEPPHGDDVTLPWRVPAQDDLPLPAPEDVRPPAQDAGEAAGDPSPTEVLLRQKLPGPHSQRGGLHPGVLVGHFRVKAPLGRGGMGHVYRAEDEHLRREVALKVLPPVQSDDAARRRQLLQEARAAAVFNHPNIATIYEVGEADGCIYIAMELIEGQSLGQRLKAGRLAPGEAIRIGQQILRGLQQAHKAGMVHRDLKPDNVMLTGEGVVKVLDFGLAKHHALPSVEADSDSSDAVIIFHGPTLTGAVFGTPPYMSPEHAQGLPIDHRSDLFSFGAMFYEMLAGHLPFPGTTVVEVITAVIQHEPQPLSRYAPEVSPALAALVSKCLAKNPDDRYRDCESIATDLEQIAQRYAVLTSAAITTLPPRGGSRAGREARAALLRTVGIAAGVTVLLGLGAAGLWRLRSPAAPAGAATSGITVTDLPLPSSPRSEAVAAYKAALSSIHEGNWGQAQEYLERAVSFDPLLAAAHLRLALSFDQEDLTTESRASFARAVEGRASLSERDQALLRALEPTLSADPPNKALTVQRLREATERYPRDAELFLLVAYFGHQNHDVALRAARRATELDPLCADAWQVLGLQLSEVGRNEEGVAMFDRCVALSSATKDCRVERAKLYQKLGRCTEMEDDLRQVIAGSSSPVFIWYKYRPEALFALGRPVETVHEALLQKWALLPADKRIATETLDQAKLEFETGHFARAEALAREEGRLLQADRNAAPHAEVATLLVQIHVETGRLKEAAKVADDYLKRKDVWVGESEVRDVAMLMHRTLLHAGVLSKEAFATRRDAWLSEGPKAGDTDPAELWLSGYVSGIERREEAEEALDALAKLPPGALPKLPPRRYNAALGKLYLLAGRTEEAQRLLLPSSQPCTGPGGGLSLTFARGQAEEKLGYQAGACAAYAKVLDRWGSAAPRSITADKARARSKVLHCADL